MSQRDFILAPTSRFHDYKHCHVWKRNGAKEVCRSPDRLAEEVAEFHHRTTRTLSGPAPLPPTFVPPNKCVFQSELLCFSLFFVFFSPDLVLKFWKASQMNWTLTRSNSESVCNAVHWLADVLNRSGFCWSSLMCHNLWLLYFACYHIGLIKRHLWMDDTCNTIHSFLCRTSIKC